MSTGASGRLIHPRRDSINALTWSGSLQLRAQRMKPSGFASRKNAFSSSESVSPAHPKIAGAMPACASAIHANHWGDMSTRTTASLNAGCDVVLHCNGNRMEMESILMVCGVLRSETIQRLHRVESSRLTASMLDLTEAEAQLKQLLESNA